MNAVKDDVIALVHKELESANKKFPLFHSVHEGYAVIKEEVEEANDELEWVKSKLECVWTDIKQNNDPTYEIIYLKNSAIQQAIEAIQVAAMAQKFIDSMKIIEVGNPISENGEID